MPTSENKQQNDSGRTRPAADKGVELSRRAPAIPGHPLPRAAGYGVPPVSPLRHPQQQVARLHRMYGNQAVLRTLSRSTPPIQTKLTVNQPGDRFEQEADRVADQVMRMTAAPTVQRSCSSCTDEDKLQRKCTECEEEEKKTEFHRKETNAGPQFAPPSVHDVLNSPGQPLDPATRAFMEPRFGQDFGAVRLHADTNAAESARAVNALAYTSGWHIVFGVGQHAPNSDLGRHLLAHELTHVVQQLSGGGSSILYRKDPEPKDAGETSSLEDLLPTKGGVLAAIDRRILLGDIFGEQALEQLIKDVKANPAAIAFTRKSGILALLALADTRGPTGPDPDKAKAALEADEKKPPRSRIYRRALLESRAAAPKSFWFQSKPPEEAPKPKEGEEDIPISSSRLDLKHVVQDPENPHIVHALEGPITVNFALLGEDLRGNEVSGDIKRGRTRILDAIRKVSKDLLEFPPAPSKAVRSEDERVRARLKEALRGFNSAKPLRIFLASDESEVITGLRLKTETIFVRKEDIGNDKKLEAAIRVPLVVFQKTDLPPKDPLTADEAGESILHEMVHALLIRRGLAANDFWETIKTKAVQGPPTVKNRCEEMIHRFLLAQEEVFVFDNVSKLGPAYAKVAGIDQPRYELWILKAELFFKDRGVTLDKTTKKLDVAEKVERKKVNWAIEFKFPRTMTVSGTDLTPLNTLIGEFPGIG